MLIVFYDFHVSELTSIQLGRCMRLESEILGRECKGSLYRCMHFAHDQFVLLRVGLTHGMGTFRGITESLSVKMIDSPQFTYGFIPAICIMDV